VRRQSRSVGVSSFLFPLSLPRSAKILPESGEWNSKKTERKTPFPPYFFPCIRRRASESGRVEAVAGGEGRDELTLFPSPPLLPFISLTCLCRQIPGVYERAGVEIEKEYFFFLFFLPLSCVLQPRDQISEKVRIPFLFSPSPPLLWLPPSPKLLDAHVTPTLPRRRGGRDNDTASFSPGPRRMEDRRKIEERDVLFYLFLFFFSPPSIIFLCMFSKRG